MGLQSWGLIFNRYEDFFKLSNKEKLNKKEELGMGNESLRKRNVEGSKEASWLSTSTGTRTKIRQQLPQDERMVE
jgi:hypothetical protein